MSWLVYFQLWEGGDEGAEPLGLPAGAVLHQRVLPPWQRQQGRKTEGDAEAQPL